MTKCAGTKTNHVQMIAPPPARFARECKICSIAKMVRLPSTKTWSVTECMGNDCNFSFKVCRALGLLRKICGGLQGLQQACLRKKLEEQSLHVKHQFNAERNNKHVASDPTKRTQRRLCHPLRPGSLRSVFAPRPSSRSFPVQETGPRPLLRWKCSRLRVWQLDGYQPAGVRTPAGSCVG